MYQVHYLNKISPKGTALWTENYQATDNVDAAEAILVRSAAMHDMAFSDKLLAVARAGAGVNNIPLDRCAEEGIVVFNTPGANANGVKEMAICGMLMGSRSLETDRREGVHDTLYGRRAQAGEVRYQLLDTDPNHRRLGD